MIISVLTLNKYVTFWSKFIFLASFSCGNNFDQLVLSAGNFGCERLAQDGVLHGVLTDTRGFTVQWRGRCRILCAPILGLHQRPVLLRAPSVRSVPIWRSLQPTKTWQTTSKHRNIFRLTQANKKNQKLRESSSFFFTKQHDAICHFTSFCGRPTTLWLT